MSDEVDFLHVDKDESFLQADAIIIDGMFMHSQSSQNSKFAMSFQYLRREVRDEVNFCVQINISFLQVDFKTLGKSPKVDTIINNGHDQTLSKYSVIFTIFQKKKKLAIKRFNKNVTNKILQL